MPADLTPTARVILGMLALGKDTGYDIKQLVDKSTRHFWAASYGQIYPELRRLEERGLIKGRNEPTGGRPRTAYVLTKDGSDALVEWLSSEDGVVDEVRDEYMLKLFFSDAAPAQRLAIVRTMREGAQRKLSQLRAIGTPEREGPRLTLSLGIAITEQYIEWCAATERRLTKE